MDEASKRGLINVATSMTLFVGISLGWALVIVLLMPPSLLAAFVWVLAVLASIVILASPRTAGLRTRVMRAFGRARAR
jgi:hypothetical protein